jgi:hypothetical protein
MGGHKALQSACEANSSSIFNGSIYEAGWWIGGGLLPFERARGSARFLQ